MNQCEERICELKKIILQTAYETHEGHVPSAFSILDILYVLYHSVLKIDPNNPKLKDRDYLIVSKGHSAVGIYAILADCGFIGFDELKTFGKYNSRLGGHPDFNKVPGIEASTGSLGHGLPIAVGMAMGLSYRNDEQKVFCIVGDGELNEGSMWEALTLAGQHKLKNLICIVDYNHSLERSIAWGRLDKKIGEFGWDTDTVDGHDHAALYAALTQPHEKPLAIIANTIKGKGCPSMEQDPAAWHHRAPKAEELEKLLEELEK